MDPELVIQPITLIWEETQVGDSTLHIVAQRFTLCYNMTCELCEIATDKSGKKCMMAQLSSDIL